MAEMIAKKSKLPPKTVALTLDDGTEDNFLLAFPVLKEYGLKATIFLIYGQMDRPGWLKWEEIKSMQESSLVEFASHTSAHAYLPGVSSEEALRKEIFDSKKALEEKLGRKVSGFSYPVGGFNPRVRQLVIDAGYSYAATVRPGKRFPDDDLFALKRIRVSHAPFWLISYWIKLSGYYTSILESRRK
jgi:peptidoglycan/xylan/chitin deacetylase (PgdA/CDA1 family)